ncbi:NAD(P)-binding domain-containing protein [Burkholderia sp. MSMB1078WGS]|uniref:NAD(P)-binding domain-containing protein n=1 Tax=Burkholderia sp. MSMB1078WGS TaxID=1637900 RepID=UPI0009E7FE49|nr:NAD(P)-binding domain-containing protein [Burkholderia sp. MSMB1078WGS]
MNIANLGTGAIGAAIARNLARNGITTSIANTRRPESLKELVDELDPYIRAVSVKAPRGDHSLQNRPIWKWKIMAYWISI